MNRNGFDNDESMETNLMLSHLTQPPPSSKHTIPLVTIDSLHNMNEHSLLLLNETKCCRICLEEEDVEHDDEPMIAPCMCKGSSKWVHRSCLDNWRMNEPDRAFAQCTECHYMYQLMKTKDDRYVSSYKFWNQPRMKFCFFVSRDICTITILIQLIIGLYGYFIMLLDKSQHWNLIHIFYPNDDNINKCYDSDSGNSNNDMFWCRHHEFAIYYLFGIIAFLGTIGTMGSIIFCCNGCRIPSFHTDDDENGYSNNVRANDATSIHPSQLPPRTSRGVNQYEVTSPVKNTEDIERGLNISSTEQDQNCYKQQQNSTSTSDLPKDTISSTNLLLPKQQQRRTAEYYRHQRQVHRGHVMHNSQRTALCCDPDCRSDEYYVNNVDCCFTDCGTPLCCDEQGSSGSDSCCCCDDNSCSHHHTVSSSSSSDCNCDESLSVMLFIILVFFVVMAIIGLFFLLIIGVIVCQRIVQRYLFLLQKRTLVQEFQVVDLSRSSNEHCNPLYNNDVPMVSVPSSSLHPNDIQHLQKLGLLDGKRKDIVKT